MTVEASVPVSELPVSIAKVLASDAPYDLALRIIAASFEAGTATLHRADAGTQQLLMVAQLGLPEFLIPITRQIPFGKGIAGQCAVQREPITLCNLQTDDSGAARPNAKQTGVAGAISVPVFDPSGALVGTLGVGKASEHTYTPEEIQVLSDCAALLGRKLATA
ncbi:MAG: hypothetical protein RL701_7325 [Pseudomonadota bacterium]|jgi:signal transduction protein with GAF and PtsI domain